MRVCEEDDAKGMVSDFDGMWSLGGREMSRCMKDGICVCVVVVVALMVAVVLMVVVRIVVLVMVVRVACTEVVGVV